MALITVSDLEAYNGVTYDSAESVVVSDVIDAISKYVECYTGQEFTDDVYTERVSVIDHHFFLKNNVQHVYGFFYGMNEVIEVTGANAQSCINVDLEGEEVKLLSNLSTVATLSIASADLSALVSSIGGSWTATLKTGVNSGYPSLTLYPGQYRANPDDSNKITLIAANEPMDASRVSKQLYSTSVNCAEGIAIYQGGYATIPADLKDATIRMVGYAYKSKDLTTYIGATTKEKVGDYSYEIGSGGLSKDLASLIINYNMVLDCYRTGTMDI